MANPGTSDQEPRQQKQKRDGITHFSAASAAIATTNKSRTIHDKETPRAQAIRCAALRMLAGREIPVGLHRSIAFFRGFGIRIP